MQAPQNQKSNGQKSWWMKHILKHDIPFMSYGKLTTSISLLTFIAAVFFLFSKGLNLSVEFTGGTVMEVQYAQTAPLEQIRTDIQTLKLGEPTVQALGTSHDVLIRLPNIKDRTSAQLSNDVLAVLKKDGHQVELRKV